MAAFVKFEKFTENLAKGVHGDINAAGTVWKAYLSNTAPNAASHTVKADIAEITNQNGYAAPVDIQQTVSRSGGTTSVVAVDIVITSNTGNVGPFRYVIIYDDTPTSPADPLVGYYDRGAAITLDGTNGDTFTIDFGAALMTIA